MAITHIVDGEGGVVSRGKINEAIDKANLVDGKAEQTALVAEQSARSAGDASLQGQITLRATKAELAAETSARETANTSLVTQIGQRATTVSLASAVTALQQADQSIVQSIASEATARIAADNIRVTYAEAASEPTRPGEANRFFTSTLVGELTAVAPLPDDWKVIGPNGATIAIPGAGKVAPIAVTRIEQLRQYRGRAVVQRATNTDDPANDAIRIAIQWLDKNKNGISQTVCADILDVTTASGRLEYFFNIALTSADNIDFTAPAGAVYFRMFVQTFGSGVTWVEVIETFDLTDTVEFSPDVSEFRRQLAGFNWRVEDFTTRLGVNEENIEASRNANWFTAGTLNDARLTTNVMLLAKEQTVTKDKTFAAKLRMQDEILIGDGQIENPGDAEAPTATARIIGDGDHLSIAPTDKAGGFKTLRELTFSHAFDVWLAEGGFRTTGALTVIGNASISIDLAVGRDAGVTRHLTVGEDAAVLGDLDVAGSGQVDGDMGVVGNLGVLGSASVGGTLSVTGIATFTTNATVGGTLGVTGNTTLGGTLGVTGLATLASLLVTGTATVGNDAADAVTIKGTLVNSYSSGLLAGANAGAWRTTLDVYDKAYVDNLIAAQDAMVFKGVIDCSANPSYPAADRGWTYRVSVAGKIGGASGPNVEAGDILICLTDGTAAGDQATVGANWAIIQTNIDGALTTTNIGVTVQGYDADLAAIAALTTTAFGRTALTDADAAAFKTRLGLTVGADVQAYDADLAAIAALTTVAYGRGLLTLSGAPAMRAQLSGYAAIATDADATLTVGTNAERVRHTGTLTAIRAITLATAGAVTGSTFRITRTGGGAFNLNVGTGPLKALATNTWATFIYDGAAWYLAEYGAL